MRRSVVSNSCSQSQLFDSQVGEEMNDAMENVQVAVRIRGLNPREQNSLQTICVLKDDMKKGRLTIGHTNNVAAQDLKEFQYDQVFGPNEGQQAVFENVGKQMALACLSGYNVCIFAYGQTGAGKTFTMMGDDEDKGLIQRILNFLFAKLKSRRQEFVIQSQCFEIYMEEIIDLYQPQKNKNIRVVEDFNGVRVDNLSQVQITNHNQAVELIQKGQKNRHIGATRMNAESSRSHSIFSMIINIKDKDPHTGVVKERSSKLHFVDLAGSERQKQTQATGQRLKEAAQINQSLSTLGIVIHSLAEGHKKICYRNSKLTHILKDSLGGNSKTLMIAAVSPSQDSYGETLSTLKFAERAKYIKNNALINEKSSESIDNLKKEIDTLKQELQIFQKNQKLQQELIQSYNIKKNEISNSPLIDTESQNNNICNQGLNEEEKQILINSVQEFQIWLREFLKESGFLDFIAELRMRMGININDMMCVESAKDSDSQQWSSLFQIPVENLKEYIKTIMEFNKFTGMVTGQYDIDLKNKNEQLNSQIHQLKEEVIKKELYMVECRNSVISEIKAQSQIGNNQKDQTIAELKSLIDQYVLENSQHLNSIAQMDEEMQRKEEAIDNLRDKITNLLNEIQRMKKKKSYGDIEMKEINENLLRMQEKSEEQIKQLQNEIDSLQMQNVTLQEELEAEQQRFFMQKEDFERRAEKHQTLQQTLEYKSKLIEDLQLEIQEEKKQMNLLYKNFSIEKELQGVAPFSNLWKYIQNIITDFNCEKDQKNHLIEEIQGLCLQESSILREKSEKILQESRLVQEEHQYPQNSRMMQEQSQMSNQSLGMKSCSSKMNSMLNKQYLQEYIASQKQQLSTWNIVEKQLGDSAKKENNTIFTSTLQSKLDDANMNKQSYSKFKDYSKTKSQNDNNQKRSACKQSPQNALVALQQQQVKEFNMGEKQKVDTIQQLISENKTLCEALMIKLDEVDRLKAEVKDSNEQQYKLKQDLQTELNKLQEQSKQNQYQLNQQLSQIISFDLLKQNLEEEINNLKEENQYFKQVQADNIQRLEELTREKDSVEDSCFFYEMQSKKFQDRLKSISRENESLQDQIKESTIKIISNKKQLDNLEKELSASKNQILQSSQQIKQLSAQKQQAYSNNIFNSPQAYNNNSSSNNNPQFKINSNQKFQTVSPAHKPSHNQNHNYNNTINGSSENSEQIEWENQDQHPSLNKINLKLAQVDINSNQSKNDNLVKTKEVNNSESSEFYSAQSSFSKIDAFSSKPSNPASIQNSNNIVKAAQNKELNVQDFNQAKESVQKQLNFNFSQNNPNFPQNNQNQQQQQNEKKQLQIAQFSFLVNLEEEEEEREIMKLPKIQEMNYQKSPNKQGGNQQLSSDSTNKDRNLLELQHQNQSLKKALQQIIEDSQKNEQSNEQLQDEYNKYNYDNVPLQLNSNSLKKESKLQLHLNQQSKNNSINIQNSINLINQIESKNSQKKQQHKMQSKSSSSPSSSSENLNIQQIGMFEAQNKKRSFLQILDQIEEDESENRMSSIDLAQTIYNYKSIEEQEDNNHNDIINLKDTIQKKRCNQ